jgi:hypothetical protein
VLLGTKIWAVNLGDYTFVPSVGCWEIPCIPVFKQSRVVRQDGGLLVNNLHESLSDCFLTLFYAGRVVFQLEFRLSAQKGVVR